jgi:hypothetical protein
MRYLKHKVKKLSFVTIEHEDETLAPGYEFSLVSA